MAVPTSFIYFTISGAVLIGLIFFLINFLMGGIMGPLLKVKASRGKKVLVEVENPIHNYFKVGSIEEGFLIFKDRQKQQRRIKMIAGVVYRALGVYWVGVDDEDNTLRVRAGNQKASGFDAAKYDNLYVRALYRPSILNDQKILIVLILLNMALVLFLGFFLYKIHTNVNGILAQLATTAETAKTVAAGVVR